MTTYIVTFDVSDDLRKNQLKEKLKQLGKQHGGYCPIHDNCWAIVSDQTPTQILDFLGQAVSESDRIFVIRSGIYSAWRNAYGPKNSEWLKERL